MALYRRTVDGIQYISSTEFVATQWTSSRGFCVSHVHSFLLPVASFIIRCFVFTIRQVPNDQNELAFLVCLIDQKYPIW